MPFWLCARSRAKSSRSSGTECRTAPGALVLLRLFVVDGQGGQTVQIKACRVARHVLVVALRRDHCAVVTAEFQLRQIDLGPQLLGTICLLYTSDAADD